MRKNKHKGGRRSTVLQELQTIDAVCMAEMGKNNDLIRRKGIGFTDGQFQYRLTKAKQAAGFAKGDGFRKAWREGRSRFEEIIDAALPELRKDYRDHILPNVERPTPQVAPERAAA